MLLPPTPIQIIGILAALLLKRLKRPNGTPVFLRVSCGENSLQIEVNLESLKQLSPMELQRFLLGHLAGQIVGKQLGPMMGIHPYAFTNLRRGVRQKLLPRHVARLKEAMEIDPRLLDLFNWVVDQHLSSRAR